MYFVFLYLFLLNEIKSDYKLLYYEKKGLFYFFVVSTLNLTNLKNNNYERND